MCYALLFEAPYHVFVTLRCVSAMRKLPIDAAVLVWLCILVGVSNECTHSLSLTEFFEPSCCSCGMRIVVCFLYEFFGSYTHHNFSIYMFQYINAQRHIIMQASTTDIPRHVGERSDLCITLLSFFFGIKPPRSRTSSHVQNIAVHSNEYVLHNIHCILCIYFIAVYITHIFSLLCRAILYNIICNIYILCHTQQWIHIYVMYIYIRLLLWFTSKFRNSHCLPKFQNSHCLCTWLFSLE